MLGRREQRTSEAPKGESSPVLSDRTERSGLALLERDSSRRLTVMRLCPQATRASQSDSSSQPFARPLLGPSQPRCVVQEVVVP